MVCVGCSDAFHDKGINPDTIVSQQLVDEVTEVEKEVHEVFH